MVTEKEQSHQHANLEFDNYLGRQAYITRGHNEQYVYPTSVFTQAHLSNQQQIYSHSSNRLLLLKAELMSMLCYANGEREVWSITNVGR